MAASRAIVLSASSVLPEMGAQGGVLGYHHSHQLNATTLVSGLARTSFWIEQGYISNRSGLLRLQAKRTRRDDRVQCGDLNVSCSAAADSAGNQPAESPYQVLGVSPFEKFESIKAAYTRKHKDAEKRGDEAAMLRLEAAYDQLLMAQLRNRKEGRTFGDFEISKEIKYADKQSWFPGGPKPGVSPRNDILINLAGSAVIAIWMYVTKVADWKPLQFLLFGYAWRIFMKLEDFVSHPSSFSEEDEDRNAKKLQKNGKRFLRTLAFVFGSVAIASMAFTGLLNGFELLGMYIPRAVMNSQELFVTILCSVLLFISGSYFQ